MVAMQDPATAALAHHSVKVMLANQAASGAYLASPNFAVYRYSWLRDGAFIADSLSAAGEQASALAFLDWCRRLVEGRRERVDKLVRRRAKGEEIGLADFLHTRYTVDGRDGDEEWWNHQLDGYGAWLWALGRHFSRARLNSEGGGRFASAVETTARYLNAFWGYACFDCWEENPDHVHVATLAAISAGLRVAAEWPGVPATVQNDAADVVQAIERRVRAEGTRDGHLVKWLGANHLDASLLFCAVPYGLFAPDDPLMRSTVDALSVRLAHLGVHRHIDDVFFGGGEWILLAACLGSYFIAIGDVGRAQAQLEWVVAQADEGGHLPEQVSGHLLHPEHYQKWVARWGEVARPLLWSHAMFLNLQRELREAL